MEYLDLAIQFLSILTILILSLGLTAYFLYYVVDTIRGTRGE